MNAILMFGDQCLVLCGLFEFVLKHAKDEDTKQRAQVLADRLLEKLETPGYSETITKQVLQHFVGLFKPALYNLVAYRESISNECCQIALELIYGQFDFADVDKYRRFFQKLPMLCNSETNIVFTTTTTRKEIYKNLILSCKVFGDILSAQKKHEPRRMCNNVLKLFMLQQQRCADVLQLVEGLLF